MMLIMVWKHIGVPVDLRGAQLVSVKEPHQRRHSQPLPEAAQASTLV
jgi:hypothetical protein